MNIKIEQGGDITIFPVFEETAELKEASELFKYIKKRDVFNGKNGETFSDISYRGDNVIILGLGKEENLSYEGIRKTFFRLGKELIHQKATSAGITIEKFANLDFSKTISAAAEGVLNSEYKFEKYVSDKKLVPTMKDFYINTKDIETAQAALEETINIIDGVFFARDITNEPAITVTPKVLAETARKELEPAGVQVDILGKAEIEKLGMHAFLAVSKGSENEPQLIVMTWNGNKNSDEKIALVGKGLTYDSGGYSIKPTKGMDTMYCDMAGSAAVIGAMKTIAKNKLDKNVIGIVAACENLISGGAYKPGDIISSMSGKTIEINNTDAEGRLTLADALWYATDEIKADKVIDLATLTGACVVALGEIATGAVTNNSNLMNQVISAGKESGEYVWQLPSFDEYYELIESTKADISNTGVRGAGTITAGLFLESFVANGTPWVHLDIAGTAYISKPFGYLPMGATGVPVKTLYNLVKDM